MDLCPFNFYDPRSVGGWDEERWDGAHAQFLYPCVPVPPKRTFLTPWQAAPLCRQLHAPSPPRLSFSTAFSSWECSMFLQLSLIILLCPGTCTFIQLLGWFGAHPLSRE